MYLAWHSAARPCFRCHSLCCGGYAAICALAGWMGASAGVCARAGELHPLCSHNGTALEASLNYVSLPYGQHHRPESPQHEVMWSHPKEAACKSVSGGQPVSISHSVCTKGFSGAFRAFRGENLTLIQMMVLSESSGRIFTTFCQ